MPKRVGNLKQKMHDRRFVRATILKAAAHKHGRREVQEVLEHLDDYATETAVMIALDEFVPSAPKERQIYDVSGQKWRTIEMVPFWPDAVVQWLLVETMKPVLMRGMCHWSCASIPGRGGARARKRIQRVMRDDPKGTKYAAELDIRKYYPSISIDRMMTALRRKIKDEPFLAIVESVLRSCKNGLGIGFYINQWMANFFLEPLDRYVQGRPGVKYMTRYMDNLVLLGQNKRKLHRARQDIERFLRDSLGLGMKENWQVFQTARRLVAAVGYRFGHGYTILRKRNFLRLTRQSRRIQKRLETGRPVSFRQAASFLSRSGQLKHCNGLHARQKYVDPIGVKKLKEVVRRESKGRQRAIRSVHSGILAQQAGLVPGPVL